MARIVSLRVIDVNASYDRCPLNNDHKQDDCTHTSGPKPDSCSAAKKAPLFDSLVGEDENDPRSDGYLDHTATVIAIVVAVF